MLDNFNLGSSNLDRSQRFYGPVLATLGISRFYCSDDSIAYSDPAQSNLSLWITKPFNGLVAAAGNGSMQTFAAKSAIQVQTFHAAALAHGGTNEGDPGYRAQYSPDFYAAYVRDPDGNKLAAVFRDPAKCVAGF